MTGTSTRRTSWPAFLTVWAGQLVSVTGTTVTGFGLQLFVFTQTRSVTDLALVALAFAIPGIVLAPVAGSLADRFNRRLVMLGADTLGALGVVGLLFLHLGPGLELWHLVVGTAVTSAANALQEPAWSASIPVLVPRDKLERANGLVQLNEGAAFVVAPAIAGALLATFGLGAVLFLDLVTFAVALVTLLGVRFPSYERKPRAASSALGDFSYAWRYLRDRPGLFGMLVLYPAVNFMLALTNVLIIPLVVSFASEAEAGVVLSLAGAAGLVASLAVSARGLPPRLVLTIFSGLGIIGVAQVIAGWRASLVFVGLGVVLLFGLGPVLNSASQVIWQTKVEEGAQGRVFSMRRMLAHIASPLAIVVVGPAADRYFEPRLMEDGSLAATVGAVIGTGPGRGIGFIVVLAGIGTVLLAATGLAMPRVRNLESEIPDAAGRVA